MKKNKAPAEGASFPSTDSQVKAAQSKSGAVNLPVVGLGASAGGLAAFKNFLQAMPTESGMAFVLVQHLDPTHKSLMTDLLTKYTAMPVVRIEDGMTLKPNTVFMIPPNKYLFYKDGKLRLKEPVVRRGMRMPIDFFFRSMAEGLQERAICIVLSGTGADGTLGLRAVKGEGGTVFAQDPATAQYDGMPQNAVATGLVDFVLPVEDMPRALVAYVEHAQAWSTGEYQATPKTKPDDLQAILALLRARTNHDFRCYKRGTLTRRIHRRIGLLQVDGYAGYLALLREDAGEAKALLRDLLIGVTSFFRDPEAWKELEELVLERILALKDRNDHLRVWVPGCSSGEEAYSLAMLITEVQNRLGVSCPVQIFASDIDEAALEVARNGVYPESILADIPQQRLRRFFESEEENYRVRVTKHIRDLVVFANQNLVRDPPFSKLDLISCRNLLIYLDTSIQKRVISLLHFSLNEGGYLFLGSSESVAHQDDLFEAVSKKSRIYRRIGVNIRHALGFPLLPGDEERRERKVQGLPREPKSGSVTALAHEILLQEYAPAAVIVNRRGEAAYYHGPISRYLEIVPGEPTRNIAEQAKEGLRLKIRSALQRAIRENKVMRTSGRIRAEASRPAVAILVRPLDKPNSAEDLLLVTFEDIQMPETAAAQSIGEQLPEEMQQLEYELTTTREDLQSTIEELETSNEELKASNEEVMSMNEELQSTNEELETSKEELQSLNEELSTVNNQLQDKVQDLEAANNDMANLLDSTSIATLFLDRKLQVRRFTPSITRLFHLIPGDVGRHLEDIALRFRNGDLMGLARRVLANLQPVEKTVLSEDGGSFLCRILPYRTFDDHIDGVVLTFIDISDIQHMESELRSSEEQFLALVTASSDVVYRMSPDWTEMRQLIGRSVIADTAQPDRSWLSKYIHPDDQPRILAVIKEAIRTKSLFDLEHRVLRLDGSLGWAHSRAIPIQDSQGDIVEWIGMARDVTTRKKYEFEKDRINAELEELTRVQVASLTASAIAHELGQPLNAVTTYAGTALRLIQGGNHKPERLQQAIAGCARQAERAGQVVHELLNALSNGTVEKEPIYMNNLVRNAVDRVKASGQYDFVAEFELEPDLPEVMANRTQIEKVLCNLIDNGLDAMRGHPEEGRTVSIQIQSSSDQDMARVTVRDTGPGVSPHLLSKIFDPFYSTKAGGLGMGLAISRSIVEAHSGQLWVEPEPNLGASFHLTLPFAK